MNTNEYSILKIYASSTDKIGHKLLYEYIIKLAKERKLAGATVFRGVMGFGQSSKKISSSKFWELTEKLPVLIELIDQTSTLEDFYMEIEAHLQNMHKGCLVSMEPIQLKLLKPGRKHE